MLFEATITLTAVSALYDKYCTGYLKAAMLFKLMYYYHIHLYGGTIQKMLFY